MARLLRGGFSVRGGVGLNPVDKQWFVFVSLLTRAVTVYVPLKDELRNRLLKNPSFRYMIMHANVSVFKF